jgi:glycosyltransferase involved in cell wall biosynthesis
VIVPVYDEVGTIDELLRQVLRCPLSKQILVVDDASNDGTAERLSDWSRKGQIELVQHDQNRGKGAAIRTALARAVGEYVIIQDADLEYDPQDYVPLIEALRRGDADVVYGSRYAHRRGLDLGERFTFRCGIALLNLAVRILYGVRLTDEATCYKVFPRQVLEKLNLECERFEFCPEVTAKACRLGLAIHEVPISYRPRTARAGKKLRLRDGFVALYTLWKWRKWQPVHRRELQADVETRSVANSKARLSPDRQTIEQEEAEITEECFSASSGACCSTA